MANIEAPSPNIIYSEFWVREQSEIEKDLAWYRSHAPVTFVEEPTMPAESPIPQGAGTWILSRHAEILEASRNPEIFSSAQGITILDSPPEFNEYFQSMIAMDDPRHARLRRIVSAGFTPRMLQKLEDSVQQVAADIVDNVCEQGEIDFVVDVAAALPLKIVCDLMGVPEAHYQEVFDCSNVILGAGDPEYIPADGDILSAIFNAGLTLQGIMEEVAESKRGMNSDDLTTALVNAELEDDKLTSADLASFFILLVVAGNDFKFSFVNVFKIKAPLVLRIFFDRSRQKKFNSLLDSSSINFIPDKFTDMSLNIRSTFVARFSVNSSNSCEKRSKLLKTKQPLLMALVKSLRLKPGLHKSGLKSRRLHLTMTVKSYKNVLQNLLAVLL